MVQNTYGKPPEMIKEIAKVFSSVLSGHSTEDILNALKSWLSSERDFPTPADIVKLIAKNYQHDKKYLGLVKYRDGGGKLNVDQLEYIKHVEGMMAGNSMLMLESR